METRRPENVKMEQYLSGHGIKATPKYLWQGSLRGCWRLWGKGQAWTEELRQKLTMLGFKDYDGLPLKPYSGNGGAFMVFVRITNWN